MNFADFIIALSIFVRISAPAIVTHLQINQATPADVAITSAAVRVMETITADVAITPADVAITPAVVRVTETIPADVVITATAVKAEI